MVQNIEKLLKSSHLDDIQLAFQMLDEQESIPDNWLKNGVILHNLKHLASFRPDREIMDENLDRLTNWLSKVETYQPELTFIPAVINQTQEIRQAENIQSADLSNLKQSLDFIEQESSLLSDRHLIQDFLDKQKVIFRYEGEVYQGLVVSFLKLLERKVTQKNEAKLIRKKLFNIMVEMLQNISRHAENEQDLNFLEANNPIFTLGKIDDLYILMTQNPVSNEHIRQIYQNLTTVNEKSLEELRDIYRKIIKQGLISSKGGAGIGYIDLRRKSQEKFLFDFQSLDSKYSLYRFVIRVDCKHLIETHVQRRK